MNDNQKSLWGHMPPFNFKKDKWNIYKGRFEQFTMVFKMDDDKQKKAALLNFCGNETYQYIYNLCCPEKLCDIQYTELIKKMDEHFLDPINVWVQRKRFFDCNQEEEDSCQNYIMKLREAAIDCKFGDHMEDVIMYKFVTGINNKKIFEELCDEKRGVDSSKKALEEAKKIESKWGVEEMGEVMVIKKQNVNDKTSSQISNKSMRGENKASFHRGNLPLHIEMQQRKYIQCKHCGYTNHLSDSCRFKNAICRTCNKRGHMQKVCTESKREVSKGVLMGNEIALVDNEYQRPDYNIERSASHEVTGTRARIDIKKLDIKSEPLDLSTKEIVNKEMVQFDNVNRVKQDFLLVQDKNFSEIYCNSSVHSSAIELNLLIDKKIIKFMVDTGASISAIPGSMYDDFLSNIELIRDDTMVKDYSGNVLRVRGCIYVSLIYNDLSKKFKFLVIDGVQRSILGRDFFRTFAVTQIEINQLSVASDQLKGMIDKYKELFDGKLGKLKNVKVHLDIIEGVSPKFVPARKVPYAFLPEVEKELNTLENAGIIKKIEKATWGTPLVPILKENGGIRICADYKITLNKYLKDTNYRLPNIDDILYQLREAQFFSKLDLDRAYYQLELDEESKELVSWSTHLGNYQMNRLPFGVKPASGIFQREIEKVLNGIKGVVCFLDDVLVFAKDMEEHNRTLNNVFNRLSNAGMRVNASKCEFGKREIGYLGYIISCKGINRISSRYTVNDFPIPKSITEVRSFCGLVNYFGKFMENLSTKMHPIYNLLRQGEGFKWSEECNKVFDEIKRVIMSDRVLVRYNPEQELVLTCDASNVGIGAVLSHRFEGGIERPIEFASRTLSDSEKNYGVIEKEALAIIFGTKKFFQYLIGRHFILVTDHKPLVAIFGEHRGIPQMSTSRLQRWAFHLSAFNYTIEYVKSNENCADSLSRFPSACKHYGPEEVNYLNLVCANKVVPIDFEMIKQEIGKDKDMVELIEAVKEGNLDKLNKINYAAYLVKRDELVVEEEVLMWGHRVVIPPSLRQQLLHQVHQSHFGIVKTKAILRSYVWWPNIDKDIEVLIRKCASCINVLSNPPKATVIPWMRPNGPWKRIHIDFAGPICNKFFFIILDAFSKWIEVFYTVSPTAEFTVRCLSSVFARFGLPEQLVSDNGTQFVSSVFKDFMKSNKIKHSLTPTYFPATNGAAENAVKTVKKALYTAGFDKNPGNVENILCNFLFDYRNIPHCTTGVAPTSLVFKYKPKIKLDLLLPQSNEYNGGKDYWFEMNDRKIRMFEENQEVLIRNYRSNKKWILATVVKRLGPRLYTCRLSNRKLIRRHVDQIRGLGRKQKDDIQQEVANQGIVGSQNISERIGGKNEGFNIVMFERSIGGLNENEIGTEGQYDERNGIIEEMVDGSTNSVGVREESYSEDVNAEAMNRNEDTESRGDQGYRLRDKSMIKKPKKFDDYTSLYDVLED